MCSSIIESNHPKCVRIHIAAITLATFITITATTATTTTTTTITADSCTPIGKRKSSRDYISPSISIQDSALEPSQNIMK